MRVVVEGTTAHVYECSIETRDGMPVFVFDWTQLAPLLPQADMFAVHTPSGVYQVPRARLTRRGQRVTNPHADLFYLPVSVCTLEHDNTRETTIPDTAGARHGRIVR